MTRLKIGSGHDDAERRLDLRLPVQETGLSVEVGDDYDRAKLDAKVRVDAAPGAGAAGAAAPVAPAAGLPPAPVRESEPARSVYLKALLLLVAGAAMAEVYLVIARGLPVALVPLVLVVSLATLYLFALVLVPESKIRGMRSFGRVLSTLIGAAFPGGQADQD